MPATRNKPNPGENYQDELTSRFDSRRRQAADEPTGPVGQNDDASGNPTDPGGGLDAIRASEESPHIQRPSQTTHSYRGGGDTSSSFKEKAAQVANGVFKTKKGRAGLFGGGILSLGLFFTGLLQGPLQLVQLSSILQNPLSGMERDKGVRGMAMVRYWKTGDIGQTRLSFVGSRVAAGALTSMEKVGVKMGARNALGNVKTFYLDSSKHPATKGQSLGSQAQRAALAKFYDVDVNKIKPGAGAGNWILNSDFDIDINDRVIRNTLNVTNNGARDSLGGKLITSQEHRILKRLTGLPRLFSPMEKKDSKSITRIINILSEKEKAAQERREERRTNRGLNPKGKLATKIDEAKAKMKANPKLVSRVGSGLAFTAAACAVRNVAGVVAVANRAAIVMPAMIEATHYTSAGDRVKYGENMNVAQAGLEADFLTDKNGRSVFESQGVQALSNSSATAKVRGEPIGSEYKQAFSNGNVEAEVNSEFGGLTVGPVDLGAVACSDLGLITQGIAGAALTFGACATVVGCGVAGAKFAGSAIAASLAIAFVSDKLVDALTNGDLDLESLSGPQRGNLLAYGAREAANINARASAGTKLDDTDSRAIDTQQRIDERNEIRSKPIFARLFDVNDSHSLASQMIIKTNLSPSQGPAKIASGLGNSISLAASGLFTPSALAQSESYDWGFPRFGIPRETFDNPEFADPYVNAEEVSSILGGDEDHEYIKKSLTCFGVNINKDAQDRWQAVVDDEEGDVNPASKEYHDENCQEDAVDWKRVQMFIFDSRVGDTLACFSKNDELSEESCANLDIEAAPEEPSGDSSAISEDPKELAQWLLDSEKYNCDNDRDCEDLRLTARGESIKGGVGCVAEKLDVRVLKMLVYLIDEEGYSIGTYALCRSHSYNSGAHPRGKALDISSINNKLLTDSSSKEDALAVNEIIFGLTDNLKPKQIITAGVGNTRSVDPDFVKFNRCAAGVEGAAAVECFGPDTMAGHSEHIHVGY